MNEREVVVGACETVHGVLRYTNVLALIEKLSETFILARIKIGKQDVRSR